MAPILENNGWQNSIHIDTIINFLSILFAVVWDIGNSLVIHLEMAAAAPTYQYNYRACIH